MITKEWTEQIEQIVDQASMEAPFGRRASKIMEICAGKTTTTSQLQFACIREAIKHLEQSIYEVSCRNIS